MSSTPKPLRYTDQEVADVMEALWEHGEGSPEYKAALTVCAKRLSDWIDEECVREVTEKRSREA